MIADMSNPPPKNPRVNDTWIDSSGELQVWDGTVWKPYEDLPTQAPVVFKEEKPKP